MKILLFGDYASNGNCILGYYQRGFESLGHEVRFFHMSSDGSDEESTNRLHFLKNAYPFLLAQRAIRRVHSLAVPFQTSSLISKAISIINDFQPDVALTAQGGMSKAWPSAFLDVFNEKNVPIFNYCTDLVPEDDKVLLATIPLYTAIFTYNRNFIPVWYWYGAKQVNYIPFASDPTLHIPRKPDSNRFKYYHSPISYLGSWKPPSDVWPTLLIPYGLKIWGNQWHKLPANHELRSAWQGEGKGMFEEFSLICAASDIVFNFVQTFTGQGHSMKTFEIPACQGFAITNRTEEQLEFFPEDKACVYFSTAEELIDKTEFYLSHDSERNRILEHGYEIAMKHRYHDRAKDMIRYFQEVC